MSVRCSQGHENPDGSAFCDECGEPLAAPVATMPAPAPAAAPLVGGGTRMCPNCGAANPASEAFCKDCGANMNAAPAAATPAPAPVMNPAPAPAAVASAVSAPPAKLVVESDNSSFDLSGKNEVMIGREDAVSNIFPDVDLAPHGGEEGGVGRRHARILIANGQYVIEDLNSINYTFVNKQKIAAQTPMPIKNGDEIRLGRVVLRFNVS